MEAVRKTEGDNIKEEKDTRWHSVTIQYILIREFSEEVRRIIGGGAMGFPLTLNPSAPTRTLRHFMVRSIDPLPSDKVTGPIYRIQCGDYFG